eukprot:15483499-Alexandrium_andersonii.AAC.1
MALGLPPFRLRIWSQAGACARAEVQTSAAGRWLHAIWQNGAEASCVPSMLAPSSHALWAFAPPLVGHMLPN